MWIVLLTDLKNSLIFSFDPYGDLMRSRNSFREKQRVALDSGDQKLYKKNIFKILLKNIASMKIKQSGNLNSKK